MVLDCKRDFSRYSIGPIPYGNENYQAMAYLKHRVFFIVPSTSIPSRQFNFKEQEWRELPPLPVLPKYSISAYAAELTEKLYVYQIEQECNFIQELDLNTLSWRTISLLTWVRIIPVLNYFPGGSSLILINGDAEVIRIDPEQATISKVGEVSPCNTVFAI
eukprot:CAMPEP_0204910846 /NCGR_PEP_ID=MMETSP1397-20131031/9296_1 /ASSEMBLY_ACC=CAM_ASM_000891 /TAXON_ID=49980 /ORGANISM="Climacostomum Climacostomum virens, Strain Stock W-24" /LENGTH=160 /DNA_ID=CAMNT_0052081165 /DNA_START=207 /DNA_END=686 /DNA_ORIENTATION=-